MCVGFQQAAEIDGAERVIVDSSALHCPICLGIFGTAPVILPCGHSFCGTCIRRLIENGSHISQDTLLSVSSIPHVQIMIYILVNNSRIFLDI